MARIDVNFQTEPLASEKPGDGKSIGEFFGGSALFLQRNQSINQSALGFGADEKKQSSGEVKETFWVAKSADAAKIAENLLRENFGFEDIDIQSYKKLHGDFLIFDEKQCAAKQTAGRSCAAATTDQIRKWQTSADGKKVAVNLSEPMIKFLRDFRQERLIERLAATVADPELSARLEYDLKDAVTKSGETRAAAFTDLRNVLEDDSPNGKRAAAVIKQVANLPENRENPFTLVLLAKVELKEIYTGKTVMFNPKDVTAIEQRINRAADLAGGYNERTKLRDPKKAVSRTEAQALNQEAARLADRLGKPADARFRTLLARFYAVDDRERSRFEAMKSPEWTTLPRLQTNSVPSMSAVLKESIALEKFRRDNPPQNAKKELAEDPQKREWKTREQTDGKGGVKTEAYQQFQKEGSMKPTGIQSTTTYIYKDEKGNIVPEQRGYARKMPVTVRQTTEREEINRIGTTRAFGTAGAVGAIEEVNKWTPFLVDLYHGTTAKKVEKFLRLKKADFDANNFPVPPKPERIQQMKRDLITYNFHSQSDFQRVQWTMKRLEDLSYAFWNR